MEWGVKYNHVAVIALPNCGKSRSEVFNLLKPSKILRMFIYPAIKRYKGLKPLSKQYRSGFTEICFGNRRSCPES
jgi:hypothetical protein